MTRLWTAGGETGNILHEASAGTDLRIDVVRSGAYSFYGDSVNFTQFDIAAVGEVFVRAPFYSLPGSTLTLRLLEWLSGATVLGYFIWNATTNKIEAYVGATLVATGTFAMPASVWHLFEFRILIADAGGIIQTKVNADLDINFSGDTKPGAETAISSIKLFGTHASARWDDIAINNTAGAQDNSWPGNAEIKSLVPMGVGTYTQIANVVGDATHWGAVDEAAPDGDVTYVWDDDLGVNRKDSYLMTNPPALTGVIQRAIVYAIAKQDIAGAANIATFIKSGATESTGATNGLTMAYAAYKTEYLTDPNTGLAWTEAGLAALEAGEVVL